MTDLHYVVSQELVNINARELTASTQYSFLGGSNIRLAAQGLGTAPPKHPLLARCALYGCMGNKNAVEWVFMDERQAVDRNGVLTGNRQFLIAVVQQPTAQHPRINLKIGTPKATLDGNFPKAGRTGQAGTKKSQGWVSAKNRA